MQLLEVLLILPIALAYVKLGLKPGSAIAKRDSGLADIVLNDTSVYVEGLLGTKQIPVWLEINNDPYMWLGIQCVNSLGEGLQCTANGYDPGSSTAFEVTKDPFSYLTLDGNYARDSVVVGGFSLENFTFGYINRIPAGYPQASFGLGARGPDYPSFLDVLSEAGNITGEFYSIYLQDLQGKGGELLLGGVDTSKYLGSLNVYEYRSTTLSFGDFEIPVEDTFALEPYNSSTTVPMQTFEKIVEHLNVTTFSSEGFPILLKLLQ